MNTIMLALVANIVGSVLLIFMLEGIVLLEKKFSKKKSKKINAHME